MLYKVAWLVLQPFRLFFKSVGREKIICCNDGPCILIANHADVRDPWKVGPHFSRGVSWFCKKELYSFEDSFNECISEYKHTKLIAALRAKLTVWIVKNSSTIPVDRTNPSARINRKAIVYAKKLLSEKGGVLGIFPEGGIGQNAGSVVNSSFVKLAKKTGAKILPVKIESNKIKFGPPLSILPNCNEDEMVANEVFAIVKSL